MLSKAHPLAALAVAVLAGAGLVGAAGPASANNGYPVCVKAGTPVETGPGGSVIYSMTAQQAWHVYTDEANQWTQGYVSRTNPVVRGWVWGGHFDSSRAPYAAPGDGDACP